MQKSNQIWTFLDPKWVFFGPLPIFSKIDPKGPEPMHTVTVYDFGTVVGENQTPYGILASWAVNGLSIVYWVCKNLVHVHEKAFTQCHF